MRTPLFSTFLAIACTAVPAGAVVIYSDTTTFSGSAYANGGATVVSGNDITNTVADDISPVASGVGQSVDAFTFSIANPNSLTLSVQPTISIWNSDGTSGGPGTLLYSAAFNPISVGASAVNLFTFNPGTPLFVATSSFWAGITFSNDLGTLAITAAQLNQFGQGIFAPPTVGSSQDAFFGGNTPGQQGANNPSGSLVFFGGNPTADFGWSFDTIAPEPSSLLLAGAALALVALRLRFRGSR